MFGFKDIIVWGLSQVAAAAADLVASSNAAQQQFGPSFSALPRTPWPMLLADFRGGNSTAWKTARDAGAASVTFWGHSIVQGDNQNFLQASLVELIKWHMVRAFPQVTLSFFNRGISGTTVAQGNTWVSTTNFSFTALSATAYRKHWQDVAATTASKLWSTYVSDTTPDLLFIIFDLNETDHAAFASSLQTMITTAAGFAKPPTVCLVDCHTGTDPTGEVVKCAQVIRDLAIKNKCLLLDAGRVFNILTTGIDPAGMPSISGEFAFSQYVTSIGGLVASLDPAYWVSKVGTGYTPTGTTVRDVLGGNALTVLRTRLAVDGAVQTNVNCGAAGCIPAIYYRVNPADANYGANTGQCYYLQVSGTTATLFYRASGGATTSLGTATLSQASATNTVLTMRVEYFGGKHHVEIVAPTNAPQTTFELKTIDAYDFAYLGSGYQGVGYSGAGGFFNVPTGSLGNKSTGTIFEYGDRLPSYGPMFTKAQLLGSVSDFTTNPNSYGGNTINHMTGPAMNLVYTPALHNVLVKLAAA